MDRLSLRWVYIFVLLAAVAASGYVLTLHMQERAMHVMPVGLTSFKVTDPPPGCGRWREHMPANRDAATYRLYIEARKLWRSKIAWQLTREENLRILNDVSLAAERGDWGARALLAHFYQRGLGTMPSNRVLEGDADKSVAIVRQAAAAGQPWGLYDLGVAYVSRFVGSCTHS